MIIASENTVLVSRTLWSVFGLYWIFMSLRVARTEVSESLASRLFHLIPITLGFILLFTSSLDRLRIFGGAVWPQTEMVILIGFGITVIGLSFAVWARIHLGRFWSGIITLKEGHRLIRSGPYKFSRHPIYTGIILGALGTAISLDQWREILAVSVISVTFWVKSRKEERALSQRFGDEYKSYCSEVKSLIPYIY